MPLLTRSQLARIDAIQRQAAELILGVPSRAAKTEVLLAEAGLLPARSRAGVLAGELVCKARARPNAANPLARVVATRTPSWVRDGTDACCEIF